MLLIDASNVAGGGAVLLQYLVDKIDERRLPFFVLKRKEVTLRITAGRAADVDGRINKRKAVLQDYCSRVKPDIILCFGNFPPPFRSSVRTITYFHNQHILRNHDSFGFSKKDIITSYARRMYLSYFLRNADAFVVQTPLVRDDFVETFGDVYDKIAIYPFYNEEEIIRVKEEQVQTGVQKLSDSFLYASSSEPHKNHFTLLRAWEKLANQGYYPSLRLTIVNSSPFTTPKLKKYISHLQDQKIDVSNLGSMTYENLLRQVYEHEYCIFPSINETLGLGLVEAQLMGNSIAVSKKPFVKYIVQPSVEFDPYDADDITNKVRQLLIEGARPSKLIIQNKIHEFIDFIYQ